MRLHWSRDTARALVITCALLPWVCNGQARADDSTTAPATTAAATAAGTTTTATPAETPAATAAAVPITIGVVDEDDLAKNYKKYTDAVSDLEKKAQDLDKQLASRELLNEEEGKRFDDLIAKPSRTAAEDAELAGLVATGTNRRSEYIGLVGKASRTADEDARMKTLQAQAQGNQTALQRISDTLYSSVKQQQEATDKEYTDRANTVIGQVAQEMKLTLVMRKRAVIWNNMSIDITAAVVKRLNQ